MVFEGTGCECEVLVAKVGIDTRVGGVYYARPVAKGAIGCRVLWNHLMVRFQAFSCPSMGGAYETYPAKFVG